MRTRVLFIFVFFLLLIVKKTEGQGTLITKSSITPNTCSLVDSTIKLVSSNLPIIIIDTKGQAIPLKDRVVVDMKIIYNGEGVRNNIKDEYNDYDGKIAIERRGWSSRKYPKKQYAFETQDEKGENLNVSLMGLPAENDWVLNAPYGDKSLMRNVLTYQLARNMGWYASRTKFCELIFDNEYRGVYVLIEKIKRDKNRVDISKLKPDEISGDDLTGGYIIKIDKFDEGEDSLWISAYPSKYDEDNRIHYLYRYPEGDDIVYEQKKYIQNYVYEFETIMDGPYYTDPITGYYTHINVNSFVDFFIINEIGRNIDGYRLSTYMFKDKDSKGGKLTMGPVWDFNLAFGNANYYDGVEIDGWDVEKMSGYGHGKYNIPFWWKKFMADARFMNRVFNRWHELREDILSVDVLFSFIDSVAISLDESQTRNFIAWDILGNYVWPNARGYDDRMTYQDEIDYLKQWLHERIEWMDNNIPADAAAVTWVDPDSVNLSGFVGVEKVISISEIVKDSVNIDFCVNNFSKG